ncbi:DUF6221 family protein [Sphaerisporangium sp. NBC_01403]|uniref:DUF6221 family protein n=1 Tax=Sphaerisporangium sp. NBC_01403 TaxID=2903599 RepID=UPI00324973E3
MDDLIAFLRARLGEDEETARVAGEACIAWLTYRDDDGQMRYTTVAAAATDGIWIAAGAEVPAPTSALVVYDPARALREVEAKRRIISEHAPHEDYSWACRTCSAADSCGCMGGPDLPCPTLRLLALPYADHPDYREEWRP